MKFIKKNRSDLIDRSKDILISGDEKSILIWQFESGKVIKTEQLHAENILSLELVLPKLLPREGVHDAVISQNEKNDFLITSSMDQSINIISLKTGKLIRTFKTDSSDDSNESNSVLDCVYLGNGNNGKIATCSHISATEKEETNEIRIWSNKAKLLRKLKGHTDIVNKIVYYKGHKLVSASDDHSIIVWDFKKNSIIKKFQEHTDSVISLDISSYNHFFVSGSEDCCCKIFSLKELKCVRTLKHKSPVTAVKILPDLTIVTGDSEGYIYKWDSKIGSLKSSWKAHKKMIYSLQYDPVQGQIISCSSDKRIKFFVNGVCRRMFECSNEVYSLVYLPKVGEKKR